MNENGKLGDIVSRLGATHVELWHEEDKARSDNDAQVAQAKRRIDKLNQQRNDLIEKIDEFVMDAIQRHKPKGTK